MMVSLTCGWLKLCSDETRNNRIEFGCGGARILTLFTTGKAFTGHSGVIQRNALGSWMRLHADVEVILFGDDEGAADVARELGLRHEPRVERNQFGSKRIDSMFARAAEIARHDVLCFCNCDIILLPEFCAALERVRGGHERFLMVGRRWDTNVREAVDFGDVNWGVGLKELAHQRGVQQPGWSVDYFAYHPAGAAGVWTDEQAKENYRLAGGRWHLRTIDDATHILGAKDERVNLRRLWARYWRYARPWVAPAWFALLDLTRPVRRALGMQTKRTSAGQRREIE